MMRIPEIPPLGCVIRPLPWPGLQRRTGKGGRGANRLHRNDLTIRHATLLRKVIALLAVVGVACVAALPVAAAPNDDIADRRAQAVAARAEMARLGEELQPAIERYNKAVLDLQEVNQDVAFNKKMIAVTENNLKVSQAELEAKLQQSYRMGEPDLLASLLGQESLSDILAVSELFERSQQQAADLIGGLAQDKRTLKRQRHDLEVAQDRAATLRQQRANERSTITAGIAHSQSLALGLEDEIAVLVQEEAARQAVLRQAAIAALAAAEGAAANAANNEVALGGSVDASTSAYTSAAIQLPPTDGSIGAQAVSVAMQYLGVPYVWGGASPSGFDCSGLTMYSYAAVGVGLSHYTGSQWNEGARVPADQLLPGDLVFFRADLGHMGMYIGGGQYINAPQTGDVVKISSMGNRVDYQGGVRPY